MGFDENKPYAKIKIIKSNMEGEREFIITPEGRNTKYLFNLSF